MAETNPLLSDRDARFLLFEVFDAEALCRLPHFADHSRETFELYVHAAASLARDELLASYKPMDAEPPTYEDGRVRTHPRMAELYPQLAALGVLNATRPCEVEGQQLPLTVACIANAYLMAGNLSAFGYCMLTTGAAHLIEAFGSEHLKRTFMEPMYAGRWTGTMALTEPQAGSSLADVQTRATPTPQGHYLMQGNKVFISGGDQNFSENIVHLALARIEGAPPGIRGVSLFAVPRLRPEQAGLMPNDVQAAGAFHKLGWRGIPSIALNLGEQGDCHGYLVGEPHQGSRYMFQMMNEARIHIGLHGVATASGAYHEALDYARNRPQGRLPGTSAAAGQVPILAHADVRRMLLRQKAIVEGGLGGLVAPSRYQDLAEHGASEDERARAQQLLDLLTPVAKSFPAEHGFESNTLAVQVHGGYGYTSEYLPEAWLRDQKLNSIHEGTTGIQSLDLLGRKVLKTGGASLESLCAEIDEATQRARAAGVDDNLCQRLAAATTRTRALCTELLQQASRDVDPVLAHSADFLELVSILVVGWQWLVQASVAQQRLASAHASDRDFYEGQLCAAQYWIFTELPRIDGLAALCAQGEDSYLRMQDAWF